MVFFHLPVDSSIFLKKNKKNCEKILRKFKNLRYIVYIYSPICGKIVNDLENQQYKAFYYLIDWLCTALGDKAKMHCALARKTKKEVLRNGQF